MKAGSCSTTCGCLAILAAILGVPGSGESGSLPSLIATAHARGPEDVKNIFSQTLPENALEIAAAIKTVKVGQTVTLHGYLPAGAGAFGEGGTSLTLVESSESPADKEAHTPVKPTIATVNFVDSGGRPLVAAVSGKFGLKSGAEVFVTGTVQAISGTDALTIVAASVHVPRSPMPSSMFAAKAPDQTRDVSEARRTVGTPDGLKVGDLVVLRGRIGGGKEPFVAGRAVFTLMGRGLKACSDNPGDMCPTPWDYCCETKEKIVANSATVQVVDQKGQVLRTDMKGRRGIKELTEVVVTGKVTIADAKSLVINATSMVIEH